MSDVHGGVRSLTVRLVGTEIDETAAQPVELVWMSGSAGKATTFADTPKPPES